MSNIYKYFYIRNNFKNDEFRIEFFNQNQVAIFVDQDYEKEDWKRLISRKKKKHQKTQFIQRWLKLVDSLKESDAIIVTTYLNHDKIKIGMIPKKSSYFEDSKDKNYKVLQLQNVKELNRSEHPIFYSLIPAQTTLSPLKQRTNFIFSKYRGELLKLELQNLSPIATEIICTEWLRSKLATDYQIKFQLLKTGGNLPYIDIYGITESGHEVIAQVTKAKNEKKILNKISRLKNVKADIKLIFCECKLSAINYANDDVKIINLEKVFEDLLKNGYEKMLEKLIN